MAKIYNIDKTFLYEIFDDYSLSKTDSVKNNVANSFIRTLWKVPNDVCIYEKKISFSILPVLTEKEADLFSPYSLITYKDFRSSTKNNNSWHLLRQKINNLYVHYCVGDICRRRDYLYSIGTPKRLYYRYIQDRNPDKLPEILDEIKIEMAHGEELLREYAKQKMALSWEDYTLLVESFLRRCFKNYKSIDSYEFGDINVNVDFWAEDNYVISYIGKSLDGYLKNYYNKHYRSGCKIVIVDDDAEPKVESRIKFRGLPEKDKSKSSTKVIKCSVCGISVIVSKKNNKSNKCPECQGVYDRRRKRVWKRDNGRRNK